MLYSEVWVFLRILIIILTVIGLDMKMRFTLSGDIAKRAVFIKIMFFGLSLIRIMGWITWPKTTRNCMRSLL